MKGKIASTKECQKRNIDTLKDKICCVEKKSHEEWKKEWKAARNNQLFSVGSKDETAGNQSCVLYEKEKSFGLRLRLPNRLEKKFGKYLHLEDIHFSYGDETIRQALKSTNRKAMTYRFVK